MSYSKEQKAMWLEEWRRSGKTFAAFAKEKGLNYETFRRWTKSKSKTKSGFVEVKTQAMPSAPRAPEILIEKGDLKIHIPLNLGRDELRAVMEGLGGVLCLSI